MKVQSPALNTLSVLKQKHCETRAQHEDQERNKRNEAQQVKMISSVKYLTFHNTCGCLSGLRRNPPIRVER